MGQECRWLTFTHRHGHRKRPGETRRQTKAPTCEKGRELTTKQVTLKRKVIETQTFPHGHTRNIALKYVHKFFIISLKTKKTETQREKKHWLRTLECLGPLNPLILDPNCTLASLGDTRMTGSETQASVFLLVTKSFQLGRVDNHGSSP